MAWQTETSVRSRTYTRLFKCRMDRSACSMVPHSTEKTMSRFAFRQIRNTRAQSITPSPQAQPTGVPVTLPRSA